MVFTNGAHLVCSQLQSNACLLAARLMGCVILQGRAPRTDARLCNATLGGKSCWLPLCL